MKKSITLIALFVLLCISNSVKSQDAYLGEIKLVPYNFTPSGWADCNGQLLPIASNTALFSLLGTTYGGDGETTFALPDLRGRVPIHLGAGPGLTTRQLGESSGSETNTLNANNLPAHNHPAFGVTEDGNLSTPTDNYLANTKLLDGEYATSGTTSQMNTGMIGNNSTTNQAVNNMQPYLTMRYIIALVGIYPTE